MAAVHTAPILNEVPWWIFKWFSVGVGMGREGWGGSGGACACTVLLCSKKKLVVMLLRTKEGAEALDRGLLVYTVEEREEMKAFLLPLLHLLVVGSTFQTLTITFCLTRNLVSVCVCATNISNISCTQYIQTVEYY